MAKLKQKLSFKIPISFLLYLIIIITYGCTAQKFNTQSCGIITPNFRVYDSSLKKFKMPDDEKDALIYFRDSLFVCEILVTNVHSTNGVQVSSITDVHSYRFVDLKTNTEIYFKTFTDTAKPIKMVKLKSEAELISIWKFYGYGNSIYPESSATILSDTIVNDTTYKRVLTYMTYPKNNKIDTAFTLHYANCNTKNNMFQYSVSLSKKFASGCPIQMNDLYWTDNPMRVRSKYDFTRDSLTQYEHKVFDAWEKYVKEHPIKE